MENKKKKKKRKDVKKGKGVRKEGHLKMEREGDTRQLREGEEQKEMSPHEK